jgi:hypothetical protein
VLREINRAFVELLAVEAPRVQALPVSAMSLWPSARLANTAAPSLTTLWEQSSRIRIARAARRSISMSTSRNMSQRGLFFATISETRPTVRQFRRQCGGSIDLSLNQFDEIYRPVGIRVLDDCVRFLLLLLSPSTKLPDFTLVSPGRRGAPICPLDSGTHHVLQSFERISLKAEGTLEVLLTDAEKDCGHSCCSVLTGVWEVEDDADANDGLLG